MASSEARLKVSQQGYCSIKLLKETEDEYQKAEGNCCPKYSWLLSQFIGWVSSRKDAASDPHVYELLHKRWSISYEHVHFKLKPTHHKSWSKSSSQYQTLPPVFLLKFFFKEWSIKRWQNIFNRVCNFGVRCTLDLEFLSAPPFAT